MSTNGAGNIKRYKNNPFHAFARSLVSASDDPVLKGSTALGVVSYSFTGRALKDDQSRWWLVVYK